MVDLLPTVAVVPYLPVGAVHETFCSGGYLPLLQGRFTHGRFTNRPYDVPYFHRRRAQKLTTGGPHFHRWWA